MDVVMKKYINGCLRDTSYNNNEYIMAWEIISVMLSIFDQDISIRVKQRKYSENDSREIHVNIPVHRLDLWRSLTSKLENLANWVSDDKYHIKFYYAELSDVQLQLGFFPEEKVDIITLFSGGLDSFAGAYYNYKNGIKSDYIGYINKGEEKTVQKQLIMFYQKKFPNRRIFLRERYPKRKIELSQSTRSLFYISLAVARGLGCGAKEIRMYENGIMSLNPNIGGRFTTKTTHPKTISLYNDILAEAGYNIVVRNYFSYHTKGEIINEMNREFKAYIKDTYTCGKGRVNKKVNHSGQCGYCIPCVLRKISLSGYDNDDYDTEYYAPYDINMAKSILRNEEFNEYKANISYYQEYANLITETKIFFYINQNSKKYHESAEYLSLQRKMFNKFAFEVERFCKKYGFK